MDVAGTSGVAVATLPPPAPPVALMAVAAAVLLWGGVCAGFMALDEGFDFIILGDTFLRAYYTVFDRSGPSLRTLCAGVGGCGVSL